MQKKNYKSFNPYGSFGYFAILNGKIICFMQKGDEDMDLYLGDPLDEIEVLVPN
jgi:hypothetical protein